MIFKYELGYLAFTWPIICFLGLSLLFILLVGRNFVSGICKLKTKNLIKKHKTYKPKYFCENPRFSSICVTTQNLVVLGQTAYVSRCLKNKPADRFRDVDNQMKWPDFLDHQQN